MSTRKERLIVICPGRGTYTKETLGYLRSYGQPIARQIAAMDEKRVALAMPSISELDGATVFKPGVHTRGEHASVLIYSCALADFVSIDWQKYELVAVTGNSMGWYITLALAGALDEAASFTLINTMGSMMLEEIIGGQVIYPLVDEQWQPSPLKMTHVTQVMEDLRRRSDHEVYESIRLGGYMVFGANKLGVASLLKELSPFENYPFQLINHAAFHTPLMQATSERAFSLLKLDMFSAPRVPMIDGRGVIWQPHSTDCRALYEYTLGTQVVEPYDFTLAMTVALKEFCPDKILLLGPGSSLGGAIGQTLVANRWLGLTSKNDFQQLQEKTPFLLTRSRTPAAFV